MKKAVFLHGTDSSPDDFWMPWLREKLQNAGYEVFAPVLPENHTPNKETYEEFLKKSGWDFSDNIIIGHSSGSTTVLNLLSSEWFPSVNQAVLVGTFLSEDLLKGVSWYERGQFDNLFFPRYDAEKIKQKAKKFIFVHGSNDPYCDINLARKLCKELGGEFIEVENGHHLAGTSGVTELPQLLEKLDL